MTDPLTPVQQQFWDLANNAIAIGGAFAVLASVLLGMGFVRAVW